MRSQLEIKPLLLFYYVVANFIFCSKKDNQNYIKMKACKLEGMGETEAREEKRMRSNWIGIWGRQKNDIKNVTILIKSMIRKQVMYSCN